MGQLASVDESLANINLVQKGLNNNKKNTISSSQDFGNLLIGQLNKPKTLDNGLVKGSDEEIEFRFNRYMDKLLEKQPYYYDMCNENLDKMSKLPISENKWKDTLTSIPWKGMQEKFITITNKIMSNNSISNKCKSEMVNGMTSSIKNILDSDMPDFEKFRKILSIFSIIEFALNNPDKTDFLSALKACTKELDEQAKKREEDKKSKALNKTSDSLIYNNNLILS